MIIRRVDTENMDEGSSSGMVDESKTWKMDEEWTMKGEWKKGYGYVCMSILKVLEMISIVKRGI